MITIEMDKETQSIDYKTVSLENLVAELKSIIDNKAVQEVKEIAGAIRASFYYQYNEQVEKAKEAFIAEGGNEIDFEYSQPIQTEFKNLWKLYVEKKNAYHQKVVKDLSNNLVNREAIIAEIKALVEKGDVSNTYQEFQKLQESWKQAGSITSEKYQEIWGNYHLYVEQFYDLLHINNDLRAVDFKHNLEAKKQIIEKAKELLTYDDVQFAFNELQVLHRIWKEETGPVAKEFREVIWQEFSEVSNALNAKRVELLAKYKIEEEGNLEAKRAKISEIKNFDFSKNKSFGDWKKSIDAFEVLKEEFVAIGKIPKNKNKETWDAFKEATKEFNNAKNEFFKDIKKAQSEAIQSKKELIKEALEWKDSEDFTSATDAFKRIQANWKKVGFVPRKQADALWTEFKTICDAYFDKLNTVKKEGTPEEQKNYANKVQFLADLEDKDLTADNYKEIIKEWLSLGAVPSQKNSIDQDICNLITKKTSFIEDVLKVEEIKYELKISYWISIDSKKIFDEYDKVRKEVDAVNKDLKQLENNLGFFANAKKGNPLFDSVMESISKEKSRLALAKRKIKLIKSIQ